MFWILYNSKSSEHGLDCSYSESKDSATHTFSQLYLHRGMRLNKYYQMTLASYVIIINETTQNVQF